MVPVLELSEGIAGTIMRLGVGDLKSITPERLLSLALQTARKLVPGCVAEGLLSTMTLLTGAASKLNLMRKEASITSAAKAGLRLETTNRSAVKTRENVCISKGERRFFIGQGFAGG